MRKGIIMEINDEFLTLLTPDGEFLRSRKQKNFYSIGEEIVFTPFLKEKRDFLNLFKQLLTRKPLPVLLTALLLFFISIASLNQNNKAYAYMSIDVNPSIELGLNNQMRVVKLTAFNHDGEKIISHIGKWKNQEVSLLTKSLLNEMKKQGFFEKHHLVVISTVRTEKKEESAEKMLAQNLNEIKKEVKNVHLNLTVLSGTKKEMEKAHQSGMTTGKYQEMKMHSSSETPSNPSPQKGNGLNKESENPAAQNKSTSSHDKKVKQKQETSQNSIEKKDVNPHAVNNSHTKFHNSDQEIEKQNEDRQSIESNHHFFRNQNDRNLNGWKQGEENSDNKHNNEDDIEKDHGNSNH